MIQPSLFDTEQRGLFEQVSSVEHLAEAYRLVRANRGAPGVDGVDAHPFGEHLQEELSQLSQEVRSWQYQPKAVRRVRLVKPEGGGERRIGIPAIRDRVLQQSLKMSLEGRFEPDCSRSSFGFRPKRGQQQAIEQARKLVAGGKNWVVDLDLEKFLDTIPHDRLIERLSRKVPEKSILKRVGLTLRSGVLEGTHSEERHEGTVQGSPLSPLLSNILLDELDKELEQRGLSFCRYADDCNIFVSSQKAAERVMSSIRRFIEKRLKLKVNERKSRVGESQEIKFLGMTIIEEGVVLIAAPSMKRARKHLRKLIPRATHLPWQKRMERINQWYLGWSAYYRMTQVPAQ